MRSSTHTWALPCYLTLHHAVFDPLLLCCIVALLHCPACLTKVCGNIPYLVKCTHFYNFCLAGASVASYLLQPKATISLGASGAVFGLFAVSVLVKLSFNLKKLIECGILGQFVIKQLLQVSAPVYLHGLQPCTHVSFPETAASLLKPRGPQVPDRVLFNSLSPIAGDHVNERRWHCCSWVSSGPHCTPGWGTSWSVACILFVQAACSIQTLSRKHTCYWMY